MHLLARINSCQSELGVDKYQPDQANNIMDWYDTQGVRVELDAGSSTHWMESEEMEALVAPLLTAAQRKLPTDLLCSDEAACAQRCAKAFLAVKVCCYCTCFVKVPHLDAVGFIGRSHVLPAEVYLLKPESFVTFSMGHCMHGIVHCRVRMLQPQIGSDTFHG